MNTDGLIILEIILAIIVTVVVVGFHDQVIQRQRIGPEVAARGSEHDAPCPRREDRRD